MKKISPSILVALNDEISTLAQKVVPSVVTINLETSVGSGNGSGVVLDNRGHILTNAHLFMHTTKKINVAMVDGSSYPGTLIGKDLDSDVAVVKADLENPPLATLGDSDRLRIGEFVLAVGSPLAFNTTITLGIVSAVGRRMDSINGKPMMGIIQTDASINPGSSGGPLFNIRGEVIGINTAIIAFAQGLCFAVPINTSKKIGGMLLDRGTVNRPKIGLSVGDWDGGVRIENIVSGSLAERAGLKIGDTLISIDGQSVKSTDEVYPILADITEKETINIGCIRDEKPIDITMEMLDN